MEGIDNICKGSLFKIKSVCENNFELRPYSIHYSDDIFFSESLTIIIQKTIREVSSRLHLLVPVDLHL